MFRHALREHFDQDLKQNSCLQGHLEMYGPHYFLLHPEISSHHTLTHPARICATGLKEKNSNFNQNYILSTSQQYKVMWATKLFKISLYYSANGPQGHYVNRNKSNTKDYSKDLI